MKEKSKYKSKASAIAVLQRLFSLAPDEDTISVDEAFRGAGRDMEKVVENKGWLSNKLPTLKYHDLVSVIYSYESGRKMLDKLQLTLEGKRSLGRVESTSIVEGNGRATHVSNGGSSSITDVMKTVALLQKKHPEFEITFDVKLRANG